jgi:hypothetical protein
MDGCVQHLGGDVFHLVGQLIKVGYPTPTVEPTRPLPGVAQHTQKGRVPAIPVGLGTTWQPKKPRGSGMAPGILL